MPPELLLYPQQRTFKKAMSAFSPNSSALHPGADLFGGCCKQPLLTLSGRIRFEQTSIIPFRQRVRLADRAAYSDMLVSTLPVEIQPHAQPPLQLCRVVSPAPRGLRGNRFARYQVHRYPPLIEVRLPRLLPIHLPRACLPLPENPPSLGPALAKARRRPGRRLFAAADRALR